MDKLLAPPTVKTVTTTPLPHRIWIVLAYLLLLLSTVTGFEDGSDNIGSATSNLQTVGAVLQLMYSTAAIACVIALWGRLRGMTYLLVWWAASITITAAIAHMAWGGTGIATAFAAGVPTAVVVGLIARSLQRHRRRAMDETGGSLLSNRGQIE